MGIPEKTETIVLSRIDVGEEDRIITFLTRDEGLLKAAAGGAKKLKGGRAAAFDLFVHSSIQFHVSSKEGKLTRVRSVEVIHPFLDIRTDYPRLCAASYLAEHVAHCVQEADPAPAVFDLLLFCLHQLEDGADIYRVLCIFDIRLLRELGMSPELEHCMVCAEAIDQEAVISPADGGAVHPGCSKPSNLPVLRAGEVRVLNFFARKRIGSLGNLKTDPESSLRLFKALHPFTVHHLGFEPRSFKMLGHGD
jgi:DNA repair protein RecO (recombination protein O)